MDELKEMWKSLLEKSVSERLLLVGDVINGGTEKDKKVNYCK